MREILFRGKRVDNGEWVEGGFCYGANRNEPIICPKHDFSTEVIPETVGQYTGLTDKNGKKIFEGDIVAGALWWQERQKNGAVTFRDGSFGLLWYRGEPLEFTYCCYLPVEQFNAFTSMCNIVYEVIGNIHDNPELLKGSAE